MKKKIAKSKKLLYSSGLQNEKEKKFVMGKMSILQYKYEIMTLFMY